MPTVILGAVAYDPKVVTIWEGFKLYFEARGQPFDYVLFQNYERQVEAHLSGQINLAWNSPLAWVETVRAASRFGRTARAIAMRDTDRDLTSVILSRADAKVAKLTDLRGKTVAVGAHDSPQATLIPLEHLAAAGLQPGRDFEVQAHDLLVGKHGDHIGGEREAVRALLAGKADAACIIDSNQLLFAKEGMLEARSVRVLAQTAPYDHCNMTVLDNAPAALVTGVIDLLTAMSYADAAVRPLLDLEGLKKWLPGRVEGYRQLEQAVDRFHSIDSWLAQLPRA